MRLQKVFAVAALGLALSACGISFKEQAISKAEETVRSQLKDPLSATFEDVLVVYGPAVEHMPLPTREMYTCGYVNARNGFGGMAGRTRFVVHQEATQSNGRMLYSSYDAKIEDPLTGTPAGNQSSFDMIYWSKCRGQPLPQEG